jgi:hypothetical protein
MLNVITSQNPDVRPEIPAQPAKTYPHPAIVSLTITRRDINTSPTAAIQFRNFRLVTDGNGDPVYLADGTTQRSEYGPTSQTRNLADLYTWIASRPNAADIVGALNTLLTAAIDYNEELKAAEAQ